MVNKLVSMSIGMMIVMLSYTEIILFYTSNGMQVRLMTLY